MAAIRPRYSKEEFARRGDAIFETDILPSLRGANKKDFVAIDIETGAFEVDADEFAVVDRLRAKLPDAQIWIRRVGSKYFRRFGGRRPPEAK